MREERNARFQRRLYNRGENVFPLLFLFSFPPPLPKSALRLPKLPSFFLPPPPLGAPSPSVQLCRQLGESSAFLLSTCLPGCVYGGEGSISCRGFSGSGSEGFAGNFFPLSSRGPGGKASYGTVTHRGPEALLFLFLSAAKRRKQRRRYIFFCFATFDASMTPAVWPSEELLVFEA